MAKLTEKQKQFVDEYLIDMNATRAYKAAGYRVKSDNAAGVEGHKLLRNPKIERCIKERMKAREKRTEITQDKVLRELAKIAFASGADFAKVVTEQLPSGIEMQRVALANTDELGADKKAAISSIKETKHGIAVESYDKVRALELLGKHLGMFKDKLELSGGVDVSNPFEGLSTEDLKKIINS